MHIGPKILAMLNDANIITDTASDYGEPGYCLSDPDGLVILGSVWCDGRHRGKGARCNHQKTYADGSMELHSVEVHYPRLFAAIEEQGLEFQWADEWIVDYHESKAYRTQPDSYTWQPSILGTEDGVLFPGDGIEAWADYMTNSPTHALPAHVFSDDELAHLGFYEYECGYESGWHPWQTDNPTEISALINEEYGGQVDILFKLTSVGQFDVSFCVYVRDLREDVDDDEDNA